MTSIVRKAAVKRSAKPKVTVDKLSMAVGMKVVILDSALRPVTKTQVKERLSRNAKNGKVAEMSFSDAGMKARGL